MELQPESQRHLQPSRRCALVDWKLGAGRTRGALVSTQPPPQLSPDGRYYWDGQRWVPVQQALPPPSSYPMKAPPPPGPPMPYGLQPQQQYIAQTQPLMAQPQPFMMYRPSTNGVATASLVFGIVSWFTCPLIGGLIAVICGHIAHSQIKRTGESGSGLATTGLVLGYIHIAVIGLGLIIWLFVVGGLVALLAAIGAAAPSPSP